jgi:hypothetical protein
MLTLHVRFLWRRSGLAVDPHPEAFFELSHLGVVEVEDRGAGCGVADLAGGVVAPTRARGLPNHYSNFAQHGRRNPWSAPSCAEAT